MFSLEILRVTGKGESLNQGHSSENDLDRGERADDEKKPRYRTYAGGTVTEEVVKLSEKVVVPVKEYPKVKIFLSCRFIQFILNAQTDLFLKFRQTNLCYVTLVMLLSLISV